MERYSFQISSSLALPSLLSTLGGATCNTSKGRQSAQIPKLQTASVDCILNKWHQSPGSHKDCCMAMQPTAGNVLYCMYLVHLVWPAA